MKSLTKRVFFFFFCLHFSVFKYQKLLLELHYLSLKKKKKKLNRVELFDIKNPFYFEEMRLSDKGCSKIVEIVLFA